MHTTIGRIARIAALLGSLTWVAAAQDVYVDAVNGDDANSGSSPTQAWKTLTHALAAIPVNPPGNHVVHVAAGLYDTALGETFPLSLRTGLRLSGPATGSPAVLEAPGAVILSCATPMGSETGAERLTLRNAGTGIRVASTSGMLAPSFRDLVIEGMQQVGVSATASGSSVIMPPSVSVALSRSTIQNCAVGVYLSVGSGGSAGPLSGSVGLADCVVRASTTDGIQVFAGGVGVVSLDRCLVVDNAGHGANGSAMFGFDQPARVVVEADDTLFALNQGCGVRLDALNNGLASCELKHCTLAGNTQFGAQLTGASSAFLWNTLLATNGTDLSTPFVNAHASDSADGTLLGQPGCIASDPLFVDVAAGDYRLRPSSPCIDTADPTFGSALDRLRHARPTDGDLDTVSLPDMGAFEFEPLVPRGTAHLGSTLLLELWGPAGAATTVYAARVPLAATPFATPFGVFRIERSSTAVLTHTQAGFLSPTLVSCRVPSHPSAIGRTVTFQALITSASAPAGLAFSNAVEVTIEP